MIRTALPALVAACLALGCVVDADPGDDVASEEAAATAVTKSEIAWFWKHYDDADIVKEWHAKDGGRAIAGDWLAFHESFRQRALLDMYVATEDFAFSDELVDRIDTVMSLRDDQLGRKDEVRGKVMKAWGRFPDVGIDHRTGTWVCEMVQNGMITVPIAAFVRLATHSKAVEQRYGAAYVAKLREKLAETLDAFDADWDGGGDEGFYRFPKGYGKVWAPFEGAYLPYNRPLSLGTAMIHLEDGGIGDQHAAKYRERVRKMARFFLHRAWMKEGNMVWRYATWNATLENVSHASIVAEFVSAAGHTSYATVGHGDVDDLIGTFRDVTRHASKLSGYVDGSAGMDQKDDNQACGRWLDLASHEPKLVERCAKVLAAGFDSKEVGYAKTLRYRK